MKQSGRAETLPEPIEVTAQAEPSQQSAETARVLAAIDQWQRELLDLSRNNRLLYFRPDRGGIAIAQPTPAALFDRLANHERTQTIVPALTQGERESPLAQDQIALDVEPTRQDSILYRLRLRARSALQEQGIDILYVTFGLLEWNGVEPKHPAERVFSPLLLLPVRLDRESARAPYTLTPLDEHPILNPALAFQLEAAYRLTLSFPEPDEDGDLDLDAALAALQFQLAARTDGVVHESAYLGLFSFSRQAMYADLAASRERLAQHPVVRAVAGVSDRLPRLPLPDQDRLDETEVPGQIFQVLDADASQRAVLATIRQGGSLVVQGPPGTGKSQTIANAIAETLARGQTVLFVSEKLAALRVVAQRLGEVGLGEFCLEAHGHGGDKAATVRALAAALPDQPIRPRQPPTDDLVVLAERRQALNAYARALHNTSNPLGASAFAIHGELAQRANAPRLVFDLPAIGELTRQRTLTLIDLVRRLVPLAQVVTAPEQHPWYGCIVPRWGPLVQAQFETILDRLGTAADGLATLQASVAGRWGLAPASSLAGTAWLLQVLGYLDGRPAAPSAWLARPTVTDLIEQARDWETRCQEERRRRVALTALYDDAIFDLDLPALIQALEGTDSNAVERLRGSGPAADRALAGRGAIERASQRVLRAIPAALEAAADVANRLRLPSPSTASEARYLLNIADLICTNPRPEPGWFAPGRIGLLDDLAVLTARQAVRASAARATLTARFDESIVEAITPALATRIETTHASWTRSLRPGWYADRALLRQFVRADREADADSLDYEDALAAIRVWRELAAAEGWLSAQATGLAGAFGRHYRGAATDWVSARDALDVVRELGDLLGDLSRRPGVCHVLLDPDGPTGLKRLADALRGALAELDVALADLAEIASILALPDDHALRTMATDLERWLTALAPFWQVADTLHACRRRPAASAADLLAEAHDALACRTFAAEFAEAAPRLAASLGDLFHGLDTDWPRVLAALAWTERLRATFDRPPPESFLAALDAEPPTPVPERQELEDASRRLRGLLSELRGSFTEGGPLVGSLPADQAILAALAGWARARHTALPRLREWIDARALAAEISAAGLDGFMEALLREAPPPATWRDAFLRQLLTLWLTWRYEQAPALGQFRREGHEEIVGEFASLDRGQWKIASERIAASLLTRRPSQAGDGVDGSEVAQLLREARKQRRFRPLRRLFAELPNLLPRLKPCLLMSPLSVAQHLGESAVTFDLVVFDEASQILPPDAIGAIGRGRQVMVVGDRQQLPPTPFFRVTAMGTLDDSTDDEPPESVLDACLNAGLPPRSLLWHYRSCHEHLIAFSNAAFYDGRLRTFPSPANDERVVTFVHVPDGVYDRGGSRANRLEAVAVADLVVEHVEQRPDLSLGVIAFSEAQMLAIHDEIEARKRDRPNLEALLSEDREGGFFVKNLENVQGDERDVILFSVGYGRGPDGRLTMNFGPLNAPGGERRLNVAVTRARERVIVVSSIRAHEIDLERTSAEGVRQLRRYLEYAERGPSALFGEAVAPGSSAGTPFEEVVRAALAARGLDVVAEVGVSDQPVGLAVREDGRCLLGIECDGPTFGEAPTARDRDRLRQDVLTRLGWRVHRIWSTDWILHPDQEVERVLQAVELARMARDGLLIDEAPLGGLKPEDQPAQGRTRPDTATPGTPAPVLVPAQPTLTPTLSQGEREPSSPSPAQRGRGPGGGGRPIDAIPPAEIADAVRTVLATAFAMPLDGLVVAVARELGYQRTGTRIKAAVGKVLTQQIEAGALIDVGGNVRLADA